MHIRLESGASFGRRPSAINHGHIYKRCRNRIRYRARVKMEDLLLVFKGIFIFAKVRYRGLMKSANHLL